MNESINARIIRFAAEQAAVQPEIISQDTHFVNDLNFDSLDVVEFSMRVEDEFSIEVPDSRATELRTVRDVVHFVEEQTNLAGHSVE